MKKFISFVMAAAMVASLVPATAFAKGDVTATAKIVDAINSTKGDMDAGWITEVSHWVEKVPELQLTITNTDYRDTQPGDDPTIDVTLSLDNATFAKKSANGEIKNEATDTLRIAEFLKLVNIRYDSDRGGLRDKTFTQDGTAVTDNVNDGAAVVYDSKTGKSVSIPTTLTAAASEAAFLKWVLSNDDLDAKFSLGDVENAWTDSDADLTDDANRDKIIENGAFVAGKDVEDLIDYLAGGKDLAAAATGTTAVDASSITIKIGTTKTYTADVWDTVTYTQAEKIADYVAAGYQQGFLKETTVGAASSTIGIDVVDYDEDQVTYRFTGKFAKDDMIIFDLCSLMDRTGEGRQATVSVSSKMVSADDLVYAGVSKRGITASTKKVTNIAEEEVIGLDSDIKVSSTVGDFVDNQWFELKLSHGFEFSKLNDSNGNGSSTGVTFYPGHIDGGTAYIQFDSADAIDQDTFVIDKEDIDIESTSAKSGSTCTLTIKALDDNTVLADGTKTGKLPNAFNATTTVEIMKVVDYKVELSVDADADMPVIYSGVNVDNFGITDDSDHLSLEVTAKETFPGAWSMRKGFNFELPEHVYVTDVKVVDTENFYYNAADADSDNVTAAFWNAYRDGKHVNFEFKKRVFDDVDNNLRDRACAEMTFQLELVADPGFEGDVVLKLTGDLVDEQEVAIAKFVKPYEVKAEQNDLIIDYRYTDVPTNITITEAEAGLWAKNDAEFYFGVETGAIRFEDDPTFEIDSKSDLEIKEAKANGGLIKFVVKTESDEPATVTIKDMQLFMNRSIPAGPYDLLIDSSLAWRYEGQTLWAPDQLADATQAGPGASVIPVDNIANQPNHGDPWEWNNGHDCSDVHAPAIKADTYVGCVADYSMTVKEAFVNVVTAGRDVDDASFTTKVVVPVGENYIVAGEKQIELDTPAYINEAGYTMLPIRAVATALGINNQNVLWDQPTKTVTILYGQRIITMTQGQKVVYVNGSAIPASAAVENTNSRTFLPMRDLATALGVTDITWDQATRTATLNGNQTTSAK